MPENREMEIMQCNYCSSANNVEIIRKVSGDGNNGIGGEIETLICEECESGFTFCEMCGAAYDDIAWARSKQRRDVPELDDGNFELVAEMEANFICDECYQTEEN